MDQLDEEVEDLTGVLRRNIGKLSELRRTLEAQRDWQTRVADGITGFAGSMKSVAAHALLFGGWLLVNVGAVPGIRPFDPFPFVMLAMFASVEAIFLSTFVLISQNRSAALASRRDELDVQISLLAEHETTRLVRMVDALVQHFGLHAARGKDIESLERDVEPVAVVRAIEESEREGPRSRE